MISSNTFKKIISSLFILLSLFFVAGLSVYAQGGGDGDENAGDVEQVTDVFAGKLANPLGEGGVSTLTEFIERALEIIIMIGTPLVVLAIIYSGFLFIAAQGNATKLKNAKATLGWTLLGAVLLFGAYTFSNAIAETVQEIGRGVVTTD